MAKHRATATSNPAGYAVAVGVMSAGLMGGIAGPAMAVELNAPVVPEVSITIPELPQAPKNAPQVKVPKEVTKAQQEASKKALPAAKKVNKTAKPKVDEAKKAAEPITTAVIAEAKPVTDALKPVKKATQPYIDLALQDPTVATLVGTVVPVNELISPEQRRKTALEMQRERGLEILKAARSRIGDPYVWGATGPNAFDCSGLVQWAHKQLGINVPRTSQSQIESGKRVSRKNLQPGDIVAFYGNASHVGVYAGNNKIVHASHEGVPVAEVDMNSMPYYGATRAY